MRNLRIASLQLVLRAALFAPIVGCGIVQGTKAPQPVGSGPSASIPVAPSGLQLGYVWQTDSHNLYPVLGVSGSAHLGGGLLPADAHVATAGAALAAGGSWAIVLNQDGTLQEVELPSGTTSTLAAHIPLDSILSFSPSGQSAALGSASAKYVVVIRGLPLKAQLATVALPGGALTGIAVSDAGTVIAGLKQSGSSGTQVAIVSETHSATVIGSVQAWGGAAFMPSSVAGSKGESAAFADGGSAYVGYIANVSGTAPAVSAIADGGLLQTSRGVGISADGKWVYVADGGKKQVVRLSLEGTGSSATAIPCACNPQQMVGLTTDGIYALTSNVAGQPNWMLDTRTAQPRTFFVPAMAAPMPAQIASVHSGGSR